MTTNKTKYAKMHCASVVGHSFDLSYITSHNVNDSMPILPNYGTALHNAARIDCLDCVKHFVVDLAADVEAKDNTDETPLFDAVIYQNPRVMQMLLRYKANANATSMRLKSPLQRASDADKTVRTQLVRLLLDGGAIPNTDGDEYWVNVLHKSRQQCRAVCIVIIGIRRFQRSVITFKNNKDVIRMIVEKLWVTRFEEDWLNSVHM